MTYTFYHIKYLVNQCSLTRMYHSRVIAHCEILDTHSMPCVLDDGAMQHVSALKGQCQGKVASMPYLDTLPHLGIIAWLRIRHFFNRITYRQ